MNKVAIIQARMGSIRLQGKILKKLCGKEVLLHIVERVKESRYIDKIIVATTESLNDDEVYKFCLKNNIDCFRGSESNVLERFYKCAEKYSADVIVRITADDPLKDSHIIDKGLNIFLENRYDYVSNTIKPTYPEGIDIEIFSFEALKKAYYEATLMSEKEHVTPYIWKNKEKFKVYNFENNIDLSYMRWTLDTEDDFNFINKIYQELYRSYEIFHMEDVIHLLDIKPELMSINSGHIRNEGYLKSIKDERGN